MVMKTYLVTNTLNTEFPVEFIASKNKKYIEVKDLTAKYKGVMVNDVCLHSDFIERNAYLDYYVCVTNSYHNHHGTYEYNGNKKSFNVWFTTLDQQSITMDSFVLKLLLTY